METTPAARRAALVIASALLLVAAGCTGGEGSTTVIRPSGDPQADDGTTFRGSSAGPVAGAVFDGRTYTWVGGTCEIGPDNAFIEVTIGERSSGNAFRFILGGEPGAPPLEAGETYFTFTVRGEKEGARFRIQEGTVTLGKGLREATYAGEDVGGGGSVGGTFVC